MTGRWAKEGRDVLFGGSRLFAAVVPHRCRRLHRLYAASLGFFWVPCPLCRQPFGGHEWAERSGLAASVPNPMGDPGYHLAICPSCTAAGRGWR